MVQSLLGIAVYVAVIGSVIFGVKQFEKKSHRNDQQEQVDQPITEAVVGSSTSFKELSFNEMFPDVEDELEALQPEQLPEQLLVAEASPAESGLLQSEKISSEDNPTFLQQDAIEPRDKSEDVLIPATIHDPKRSNDGMAENLSQEILAWGQSKDLKHLPKLFQTATHGDAMVRKTVAIAIGQIAAHHAVRGDVERAIPVLGKLTQDSNLQVRQFAVQALGKIRSEKVLPYLQRSLLSSSGSVMQAANSALQNLKLNYYGETPAMQIAKKMTAKTQRR